jgi:hypothetical protein
VNGLGHSIFTQVAYCNAPALFAAANAAIRAHRLSVPGLGTARDGRPCMSVRSFGVVDQDQSDNVTAGYLALPVGRTAQDTVANTRRLAGRHTTVLSNGSDNGLLDTFVDPALHCRPYMAPDLANGGRPATALALDELQAAAHQARPVALVPLNDPMTLVNGHYSVAKTSLYRLGVDQPPINPKAETAAGYCRNLRFTGVARTRRDRQFTVTAPTPDAGAANNLFTFLAQRLSGSYDELGCKALLKQPNPVHLKLSNGVAVGATFG